MSSNLKNPVLLFIARYLAALACVALTRLLLLPVDQVLSSQVIALLYLLPVMVSTVLLGLFPGLLAGFAAFLVFNYFYIQPYYTFQVHHTEDLITLIIFLVVAVVLNQFIGQARNGIRMARRREWEATRMYELISALAGLQEAQEIASALAEHALETFRFDGVQVVILPPAGQAPLTLNLPAGADQARTPDILLALTTARGQEGELRIWHTRPQLSSEEIRLLGAYTSQAALSLERIRLTLSENRAHLLEESDQLKSSILNSVSHELRSPLAAIKASVSSLRSGAVHWNTAARDDLLATIEEETDHLNLLVGNLLDMSRIESGALKPHKRWTAIEEIAMGVATKMRKQLENHRLEMDFPDSLPLVPADYIMMEQVFTNLISNSIKYAPSGSVITISADTESDHLHVQVTNQGPHVPPDHLERIFDKFYRVTEADRVTGTGLGLSICKGIIAAHGGKIWAENRADAFVFHVLLPITLDGHLPVTPKEAGDG